jgi:hypothetical protein
LWWLKAKYAQKHLKLKSIIPDVMRISPRDIDQLEVPVDPTYWIDAEIKKVNKSQLILNDIQRLSTQLRDLESSAWQINQN